MGNLSDVTEQIVFCVELLTSQPSVMVDNRMSSGFLEPAAKFILIGLPVVGVVRVKLCYTSEAFVGTLGSHEP